MNYKFLFLAFAVAQAPLAAYDLQPMAKPEVEASTSALTIDSWNPGPQPVHKPVEPPPPPAPSPAKTSESKHEKSSKSSRKKKEEAPAPAKTEAKSAAPNPYEIPPPAAPKVQMNEMTGTISSIDSDSSSLRISIEGGFNPQFEYNNDTLVAHNGQRIKFTDLEVGDKITILYVGKDLTARGIEKLKR
jgi:outer membrane biosynthesis protein TonB